MALLGGLALTAIALALVLSGSPLVVVHRNVIPHLRPLAETDKAAEICQGRERLPAGISAIRVTAGAITGPRIHLIVSSGGRVVTSGVAGEDWTSAAVTIPVEPSRVAYTNALVCLSWPPFVEEVSLFGYTTSPSLAAHIREGARRTALGGRVTLEYMSVADCLVVTDGHGGEQHGSRSRAAR